jgi:Tol biopolymer transport system component
MNPNESDARPGEAPLESWKEIGAYLQRNAVTARRWEKEEGLPVHRHSHKSRASVYAYPSEIDAWRAGRKAVGGPGPRPLWKIPAFALTMLLCLVMVGNGIRPQVASAQGGPSKRLVCNDNCGDASLSADGRFLLYTDWSTGDLAMRDLASGQVKRLLAKPGGKNENDDYTWFGVFSPDHRQVAYLWSFDGGRGHDSDHQVRVLANEPGAKPRTLLTSSPQYDWFHVAGWDPDGKSILVVAERTLDGTWELAWVSANNGTIKPLKSLQWRYGQPKSAITSGAPDISPDGRYIAYAALAVNPSKSRPAPTDSQDQHIYVIAADGSSETEIVKTAGLNRRPMWTPDGKHLLFLSDRMGSIDLWSIAIENGKAAGAPSLGITRAGTVYYADWHPGLSQITVADLRSGKSVETFVGVNPAWSPDGKSIAFKRPRPGSQGYHLVVHFPDTGDERTLPAPIGFTGNGQPQWTRDGKGIMTGLGGQRYLYRVDIASGQWHQISPALTTVSPLDKTRYAFRGGRIMAHDIATESDREILASTFGIPKGGAGTLALSPDGRTVAFWHHEAGSSQTYLSSVGIDGASLKDLYTFRIDSNVAVSQLVWTRDGRSILFSQLSEGKEQIMRISAEGGKAEFTGVETPAGVSANRSFIFDLSPDGSRIAYSHTNDSPVEVWAADNILARMK